MSTISPMVTVNIQDSESYTDETYSKNEDNLKSDVKKQKKNYAYCKKIFFCRVCPKVFNVKKKN